MTSPESILVRAPNWLGDAVMATVVPPALKERYPGARVTVLGRPAHEAIFRGVPGVDGFLPLTGRRGLRWWLTETRRLRRGGYGWGILLPNSFSSALLFRLAGLKERIGYAGNGRRWLLTRALTPPGSGWRREPEPMPRYYLRLLTLVGVPYRERRPQLAVHPEEEAALRAYLERHPLPRGRGPLVLLNPGASYGPSKLWPPQRFAAVAAALVRRWDARVVVLCGPGEEGLARAVSEDLPVPHLSCHEEVLPLGPLKALVRMADLLITTDTGPRHLAVAWRRPVVVLMGPTDPRYTNAYLDETTVLRHPVPCSPCHRKVCPLNHHRCMLGITPTAVVEAADRWLAGFGWREDRATMGSSDSGGEGRP